MSEPLSGCYYVYGDKMYIIENTQRPELTLRKNSNSICYHAVRESLEMGDTKIAHISTHDNSFDLLIKVLYGAKRKKFFSKLLYDIYN